MDEIRTDGLLDLLRQAGIAPEEALESLNRLLTSQLDFARVDSGRGRTSSLPEVILAPGKTVEELIGITEELRARSGMAMVSRVEQSAMDALVEYFPDGEAFRRARMFILGGTQLIPDPEEGCVSVVSAGTSDLHAAEEAAVVLETMNVAVRRTYDIGVAGLHRLGAELKGLRSSRICIVCAGMDAALPTVIGGLYRGPVIAVPTSTGYGAAFRGVTALLSMLSSCSPGICVMNIDNGLGAAAAALRILRAPRIAVTSTRENGGD